ncbi:hypothetical protein TYRP_007998 [Tyrophagus putrescentiae]|nr:hypothetical protein TYRP_007998 [Tyrophagus putrescentiae]
MVFVSKSYYIGRHNACNASQSTGNVLASSDNANSGRKLNRSIECLVNGNANGRFVGCYPNQ